MSITFRAALVSAWVLSTLAAASLPTAKPDEVGLSSASPATCAP